MGRRRASAAAAAAAAAELPDFCLGISAPTHLRGRIAAVQAFALLMGREPVFMASRNRVAAALADDAFCARVAGALVRGWRSGELGPAPAAPVAFVRKWMGQMHTEGNVLDKEQA
ncbi:hypothetical protein Rsub_08537 [Raphidocelis subcapitata]|uniref:Uncharacterized protein n=1 Tax=Raphidocelis subcapitata TaxID=307507 RepID=A0A2V0P6U3_9CHLO|nr:hypothetical protein Rsub_08537 [Raphidocelis subcapitata]|eukprot:GBF95556.1 hypothetical protein Rsub_08537 [Raphidocelis subcapitata]